ncbi:MAG TPA: hypothetical protein PK156_50850 [Polyangium sp.]|nr:hypothetical protein [Polyangium sp.]
MPTAALQPISLVFLVIGALIALAAIALAHTHLREVTRLSSGQTAELVRRIKRLPVQERLRELQRQSLSGSIERRIAEEAEQVDEGQRAFAIDTVLADIALELESRASWPRAAMRISAASGVLLMALAISLHLEVFVAVALLALGACSAVVCIAVGRRAVSIASDLRLHFAALIGALALKNVAEPATPLSRTERRSRRRRPGS